MNNQLLNHCGFWARAARLLFFGFILTLLPDWGIELRAQSASPTLSPGQADFGSVPVDSTSSPQTFILSHNDSATSLVISSISTTAGFSATSGCPSQLFGGSSCSIDVAFSPTTIGTQTGALNVVAAVCFSTACNPPQTLSASLTGNGIVSISAGNDTAQTAAGTPVTINVLTNDVGTGLTIDAVSSPGHGSASISGNAITYTPSANFAGIDTFLYTVRDSFGQTASATVTVTVNAPVLNVLNDAATTAAGTPITVNVLANDVGTGLTIDTVSSPGHGTAVISGTAITYTPTANFAGIDTFLYTVRDSFGQTASATVTVTVNPPGLNVLNDAATTPAGTP
ncbi:MAG: hypothetical protein QG599_887, partial [Pseudomonadota bacterium]|nr:hypothetical protein [Pseudomonadota bacterium]